MGRTETIGMKMREKLFLKERELCSWYISKRWTVKKHFQNNKIGIKKQEA